MHDILGHIPVQTLLTCRDEDKAIFIHCSLFMSVYAHYTLHIIVYVYM